MPEFNVTRKETIFGGVFWALRKWASKWALRRRASNILSLVIEVSISDTSPWVNVLDSRIILTQPVQFSWKMRSSLDHIYRGSYVSCELMSSTRKIHIVQIKMTRFHESYMLTSGPTSHVWNLKIYSLFITSRV